MPRITIIGTGLIGGSIGLALKQAEMPDLEIMGHDREPTAAARALRLGAVDKTSWNLFSALEGASLVVLAVPVLAIKETLDLIASHLAEGTVVTDTGSSKASVLGWAEEILPRGVSFVGGHPMAGKETPGIDAADADLFRGKLYCIVPGKNASEDAVRIVTGMVETMGARPYFVDAEEHDSYVAAVSHLPFLLSSALVAATTKSPSWPEMSRLAASGYESMSRLASGDPVMHRDICLTNGPGIVHWIDAFITELYEIRTVLLQGDEGKEALGDAFTQIWEARERWLAGLAGPPDGRVNVDIPSAGQQLVASLIGEKMLEIHKRLAGQIEEPKRGRFGRKK